MTRMTAEETERLAIGSAPPASRLAHYQNARVVVYYNNAQGYNDTGRVTYMDAVWIELTKDNGERLLIPVESIRLLKLLESAKLEGDAGILLRPAEGGERRQISE